MSVVAFAQKPNSTQRVLTPKQQVLQAKRTGQLTQENANAFKFAKPALPQNMQKAKANKHVTNLNFKKLDANAVAQAKAKKVAKKASKRFTMSPRQIDVLGEAALLKSPARSNRAATTDEHGIITEPGEGTVKVYKVAGSGYDYGDLVGLSGTTKIVESTDGFVYIRNIVTYYNTGAWVKGTKSGNTITVPAKQPLFYSSNYDATISARWSTVSGNSILPVDETAENFTFTVDETAQTISLNGTSESLMISAIWDDDDSWTGYSVWETVYTYDHDYVAPTIVTVTPPAGLETTTWYTKGQTYSNGGFRGTVNLGFDGNDVYVQGIFSDFPEAWMKGTIDGTTVTFKDLQLQGTYQDYTIYAVGTDGSDLTDFVMTYDAEKGILTSENELLANASEDEIYYWEFITELQISKDAPVDTRVTPPAGLVTEDWTIARYFYDGGDEYPEEKVLQIGFDGNDVYVQGFSYFSDYMEDENWIKGTLSEDGKSITFASGQYYGNYNENYDFYFAAFDLVNTTLAPSVTVEYDAEAGTITWPEDLLIVENSEEDALSLYGYFTEFVATINAVAPAPLPAPDIVTTEWYFKSQYLSEDEETGQPVGEDYTLHVQVGIAGNDVFVKGICEDLPNTWIKGTLDPATNKVTFPTGQNFGSYLFYLWEYNYYFCGYGLNGFEDVVMDYDAEAKTLTMSSQTFMLINAYWLLVDPNLVLADVQMQEIQDVAATPAQPIITGRKFAETSYPYVSVAIPDTDVEGNPLLIDKLTYQYFYKVGDEVTPLTLTTDLYTELTEDMTEIPYDFTDDWDVYNSKLYLNMDFDGWNQIGIQSIYRGGGEEHKSEIFWHDIYQPTPLEVTLTEGGDISEALTDNAAMMIADYVIPSDITINLAEGVAYTISKGIEASANVIINGNGATIDASALADPFLSLSDDPLYKANEAGGYDIDNITFQNVSITGLKSQLVKSNNTYLVKKLLVDNSIIGYKGASKKTIFDFAGQTGGNVEELSINKSTLWADDATEWQNGGFFSSQSGKEVTDLGGSTQTFSITNSTLYNIAKGKTTSSLRKNSQNYQFFVVNDNIIVNSGKSGQFLKGLNAGQAGKASNWMSINNNSFIFDGADVEESCGGEITNTVQGKPGFKDVANGDFELATSSKQAKHMIGDPRWLVDYVAAPEDVIDIALDLTELAGSDISTSLNAEIVEIEAQDKSVGNIVIKLGFNTNYSISEPLIASQGFMLLGDNSIIDASALTKPMIQMTKNPVIEKVTSGQYVIANPILIEGVEISGLTKALFADNSKPYTYKNFMVSNSLFQYETQDIVVLNMASSMAINLNIFNSTFWSKAAGSANFIAMSGKRPWQTTGFEDETGKFICANNTFYNVAKTKQFMNTNTLKGQKYLYEFNSNIFVNTSNKKIYANMTNNKNQLTTDGKNTYFFGDKNYGDSDFEGVFFSETNYNGDAGLQDDPGFLDADNGNFTLSVSSLQQEEETGDPRWLTYYDPTGISNVKADENAEGAYYNMQGIRVAQPTKGVFIHNGKKVVVK
jgi:hypothetical protein